VVRPNPAEFFLLCFSYVNLVKVVICSNYLNTWHTSPRKSCQLGSRNLIFQSSGSRGCRWTFRDENDLFVILSNRRFWGCCLRFCFSKQFCVSKKNFEIST